MRRFKNPRLYGVSFGDGNGVRVDRNVMAHNSVEARTLAQASVPLAVYGKDLVFLRAKVNKSFPLTIDSECLRLLFEKTGVSL